MFANATDGKLGPFLIETYSLRVLHVYFTMTKHFMADYHVKKRKAGEAYKHHILDPNNRNEIYDYNFMSKKHSHAL